MVPVVPSVPQSAKLNGNTSIKLARKKKKTVNPAKNWRFTFNNYTQKELKDILIILDSAICSRYVINEETGENSGIEHLQGYVEFKKKIRPKNILIDKVHWDICSYPKKAIAYCSKAETRTGKIYSKNIKFKKEIKTLCENQLFDWQKFIINIINTEPNDRDIYWFYHEIGGKGKSVFCKYLCLKYNCILLSGRATDMKYGVVKYVEKNLNYPEIILLDIPRSSEKYLSWSGIEEVKNACFFSPKFDSDMCIGNCPHMFIFANFEPERVNLSKDRWKIYSIEDDKTLKEINDTNTKKLINDDYLDLDIVLG